MSCDDWVHVDDYDKEVSQLEDTISDLRLEIESRADNETFTLAEIILIRDRLLNGGLIEDAILELNQLIGLHDDSVRVAAMSKLNEMEGI